MSTAFKPWDIVQNVKRGTNYLVVGKAGIYYVMMQLLNGNRNLVNVHHENEAVRAGPLDYEGYRLIGHIMDDKHPLRSKNMPLERVVELYGIWQKVA